MLLWLSLLAAFDVCSCCCCGFFSATRSRGPTWPKCAAVRWDNHDGHGASDGSAKRIGLCCRVAYEALAPTSKRRSEAVQVAAMVEMVNGGDGRSHAILKSVTSNIHSGSGPRCRDVCLYRAEVKFGDQIRFKTTQMILGYNSFLLFVYRLLQEVILCVMISFITIAKKKTRAKHTRIFGKAYCKMIVTLD